MRARVVRRVACMHTSGRWRRRRRWRRSRAPPGVARRTGRAEAEVDLGRRPFEGHARVEEVPVATAAAAADLGLGLLRRDARPRELTPPQRPALRRHHPRRRGRGGCAAAEYRGADCRAVVVVVAAAVRLRREARRQGCSAAAEEAEQPDGGEHAGGGGSRTPAALLRRRCGAPGHAAAGAAWRGGVQQARGRMHGTVRRGRLGCGGATMHGAMLGTATRRHSHVHEMRVTRAAAAPHYYAWPSVATYTDKARAMRRRPRTLGASIVRDRPGGVVPCGASFHGRWCGSHNGI